MVPVLPEQKLLLPWLLLCLQYLPGVFGLNSELWWVPNCPLVVPVETLPWWQVKLHWRPLVLELVVGSSEHLEVLVCQVSPHSEKWTTFCSSLARFLTAPSA